MAATVALCFTSSAFAQENAGGSSAISSAFGDLDKPKIVVGAVGVGILAAIVANNRGSSTPVPTPGPDPDPDPDPGPDPDPDPTCAGEDPLVDGICTGTTTTVTVTASGTGTATGTSTITNTVTFTYLPTI